MYSLVVLLLAATASPAQSEQEGVQVKRIVAIEYPWFARMAVLQGTVEVSVTITPGGEVAGIRASGPGPLAEPAKDTISKWLFNGCTGPSSCQMKMTISFTLEGSCSASEHCPTEFEFDLPDKGRVKSKSIRAIVN